MWSFKTKDGEIIKSGNAAKSLTSFSRVQVWQGGQVYSGMGPEQSMSAGVSIGHEDPGTLHEPHGPEAPMPSAAELFGKSILSEPEAPGKIDPDKVLAPKAFHDPLTVAGFVNESPLKWKAPDGSILKVFSSGQWEHFPITTAPLVRSRQPRVMGSPS